jgi:hypothetical protein
MTSILDRVPARFRCLTKKHFTTGQILHCEMAAQHLGDEHGFLGPGGWVTWTASRC